MELQSKQPFWVSRAVTAKYYHPLPIFWQGDVCDWDTMPWLQQIDSQISAERSSSCISWGKSSSLFCQAHSFPFIWRLQRNFSNTPSSDLSRILASISPLPQQVFQHLEVQEGLISGGHGSCVGWCQQNLSAIPPTPKQQPLQWNCWRLYPVIEDTTSNSSVWLPLAA